MASGHGEADLVPSSQGTPYHVMISFLLKLYHFHVHHSQANWLVGCEPTELFFTVEVFIWHKYMSNHSTECEPIGIPLVSFFYMYTMR